MLPRPDSKVLSYAAPARRDDRRINLAAVVASTSLLALFYLGLVPAQSGFAYNYTRDVPLGEAVATALTAPPLTLFTDPHTAGFVWFIPLALVGVAAFALTSTRHLKLVIAISTAMVGIVGCGKLFAFAPILFFAVVPIALGGGCDGEDWSEGMVAFGAAGGWMMLWWLIVMLLLGRAHKGRLASA